MAIDETLAKVFRSYKRTASRLRDLLVESDPEDLALSFELRAERDKTATSHFSSGPRVGRLAALLRPFMGKNSAIELNSVWGELVAMGEVSPDTCAAVELAFADAERLSLHINVNDKELSARDVYFAYGEGRYFAEDVEAKQRLAELSIGPMQALLPMLFHDACASYANLVLVVLEAILEVERAHPEAFVARDEDADRRCIYCGGSEGDFSTEEHVMPESLAGDEIVLKGSVCSRCNNLLSQLDQVLLDFEPLAMLRTIYGPMTKKGKFQRARLGNFDIEKVAPREIRVTYKTGTPVPKPPEPEPDGTVRFSIQGKGRRPFEPVPLARALFKIGLGLVAWQAGPEAALDPRYDHARRFVMTGQPFPNHLVMLTTKPNAQISTSWLPTEQDTVVALGLFGLTFVFNLQATPFGLPPELPIEGAAEFWLGEAEEEVLDPTSSAVREGAEQTC